MCIPVFFCVLVSQLRQEKKHKIYEAQAKYVVWIFKDNLRKSIISLLLVTNKAIYQTFFLKSLHTVPTITFFLFQTSTLVGIAWCTVQYNHCRHKLHFALHLINYLFHRQD